MAILVVEDEQKVQDYLNQILTQEGYEVFLASNIEEAQSILSTNSSQLSCAILDRMLYQKDGASLIAPIKKINPNCSILILSALNSPDERGFILDKGADEYIGKPFSTFELLARIRNLHKRTQNSILKPTVRNIGNTIIDLISHKVIVQSQTLDLSVKEFRLLVVLSETPGRVFNKFELLDRVWEINHDAESNVVEATIRNIRRKLEAANSSLIISSKRNMGYWLET